MRIRLIHVTVRKSGNEARREEILERDRLTVGRATDNVLSLPGLDVSLHHAVFFEAADGLHLEVVESGRVVLNERPTMASRVKPGDVVRIGARELRLIEPKPGESIAAEIRQVEAPVTELERLRSQTRRGIERGLFTRRKLSLFALAAILLLFLVVPLGFDRLRGGPAGAPPPKPVQSLLESWSSGPLASMHSNLAQDCTACHRKPFQPVANTACLDCHAGTGRHTRPAVLMTELEEARCASCHLEHGGDASLLALDDGLCVDCHGSLGNRFRTTTLLDVDGFSRGHPEFRPTVVTDAHGGTVERVSLAKLPVTGEPASDTTQERSGLRFPHAKHLQPGLRDAQGGARDLACGDCHQPDRSLRLMQPVQFEDHCQSCHRLAFEELDPTREVPHQTSELAARYVFEYYAGAALRGNIEDRAAPEFARRRPGATLTESERTRALEWARVRSAQGNEYLFGDKGVCRTCHELEKTGEPPEVLPVRVLPEPDVPSWMPLAVFDHKPHRMMECESCHPAQESTVASNVLLPGVDSCRECHGDTGAVREVPVRCISCHEFHQPRHGAISAGEG